jgi:hypothetical protein
MAVWVDISSEESVRCSERGAPSWICGRWQRCEREGEAVAYVTLDLPGAREREAPRDRGMKS